MGPVGLEPQGVLGGEGSLAGAGLALPRTPYGPCRSSGRTAAAGPLGCSPSCRAPRRQGRPSGAGLPLVRGPAVRGQHRDQVRGQLAGQQAGQGPSLGLSCSPADWTGGGCWGEPQFGPGAAGARGGPCQALPPPPQTGTSHKEEAVWKKGLRWLLNSQSPWAWRAWLFCPRRRPQRRGPAPAGGKECTCSPCLPASRTGSTSPFLSAACLWGWLPGWVRGDRGPV